MKGGGMIDNINYDGKERSSGVQLVELQAELDSIRKELEGLRGKARSLLLYFPYAGTYHVTMPDNPVWEAIAELRSAVDGV